LFPDDGYTLSYSAPPQRNDHAQKVFHQPVILAQNLLDQLTQAYPQMTVAICVSSHPYHFRLINKKTHALRTIMYKNIKIGKSGLYTEKSTAADYPDILDSVRVKRLTSYILAGNRKLIYDEVSGIFLSI